MIIINKTVITNEFKKIYQLLQNADPRVEGWLFMDTPYSVIAVVLLYLLAVHHGPKYMANRKPFEFSRFLLIYNFTLVILTAYVFYEISMCVLEVSFVKGCLTVDYSYTASGLRMVRGCWLYFLSKVIELLDTIFFVLRKKKDQMTFLHIYHHSTMVFICWITTKFLPGGMKFFPAVMNCFIHILMYSYYGLSALGPHMQKYLWWKKYLTKLQIVQFILATTYLAYAFWVPCGYPRFVSGFGVLYSITLLSLFANFYYQSYISKSITRASKQH